MKLPTSEEMRALDQTAIEKFGIPSIVLMENAGVGTVNMMEKELGPAAGTFALILIGPGNNGGDGLVIGRHLHQRGCLPIFFFLINPDELTGDAQRNLEIIRKLKLPFHVIDNATRVQTIQVLFKQFESRGNPCYAIIDALFGIGLTRDIKGHFADTIELFNRPDFAHNIPIVAVDIPSGMDASTGRVYGTCLKANHTATYGLAKAGQIIRGGTSLVGKLHVIDIGIPPEAIAISGIEAELLNEEYASLILKKLKRKIQSHKGDHGHTLLLAGSVGKTGAGILAAKGALRSGCGLVSLCVPYDLNTIFETCLTEAMTIPMPTSSGRLKIGDVKHVQASMHNKNVMVIGPGIGTDSRTADLLLHLYHTLEQPMVIDADGVTILASKMKELKPAAGPRILTPHPGELSRLIDLSTEEINDNRLDSAIIGCRKFNNGKHPAILVLKGAGTVIASDDDAIAINTTGNPGMATGGMGDVLSGVIASFIAQGLPVKEAVYGAVFLHGYAADKLFNQSGQGFTATEVADILPSCLKTFLE